VANSGQHRFYGSWWSVLPPLIAILLALITKEVYSSLFVGIVSGGLLYPEFATSFFEKCGLSQCSRGSREKTAIIL